MPVETISTLLCPKWVLLLNTSLAFFAGVFMNILLLYLISKRTPKEMRSYARIIRIHCISDMFYEFIQCATGVHPNPIGGKVYLMMQGFITNVPLMWNRYILDLYFWSLLFSMAMLPIDFIFRYLSVCRNKDLTNRQLFLMVFSAYSITWIHAFVSSRAFLFYGPSNETIEFNKELQKIPDWKVDVPSFAVTELDTAISLFNNFFVGGIIIFGYGVIGFTYVKIRNTLKVNAKQAKNLRSMEVQKQVSKILAVQASLPFIVICAPTLFIDYFALSRIDVPHFGAYSLAFYVWLATVKPTATILIIPRYRNFLKAKILSLFKKESNSSSTRIYSLNRTNTTMTRTAQESRAASSSAADDFIEERHYF